jgi:membrane-associated phospholipid phosphatase
LPAPTIFCDEFAQHNTLLAISAYTSASVVGVLRVLNNRHWASDVIAGAGLWYFISEAL